MVSVTVSSNFAGHSTRASPARVQCELCWQLLASITVRMQHNSQAFCAFLKSLNFENVFILFIKIHTLSKEITLVITKLH